MRAITRLNHQLGKRMQFMHASRWQAVWRVTRSLISGKQLWLTGLGRSLPSEARRKHAIKAVDRLLGNEHLYEERLRIAAVLASMLIPKGSRPLLLVDTMEIRHKVVAFTASVAYDGRSFPILSNVVTALRPNQSTCNRFLSDLQAVLPAQCRPVLVTDGGFESAWFTDLERLGWDYIGRVRGQTKFHFQGEWISRFQLHKHARGTARCLGIVSYPQKRPENRRIVISARPRSLHRQMKTRTGPSRDSNYWHYRKNVYEPLVLATSLPHSAKKIVRFYQMRMQIEQSFRDVKCHRWGWSMRHCGCKSLKRVELLLSIAALATLVQQLAGIAAEERGQHRQHQANTVRRRVLSIFLLGAIVLNDGDTNWLTSSAIATSLTRVRHEIAHLIPAST